METSGAEPSPSRTPPTPGPPTATDEPRPSGPTEPERKHSFWRELPILIVVAFIVALVIKTFAVQAFYIPSASMEPTLVEGDRVLVEKITYRIGEAGRGDVVVFERDVFAPVPEQDDSFFTDIVDAFRSLFGFPTGASQDFIKRVIGVEGDTVEGRDGRVYVNGDPIDEPYLPDGTETAPFGPVEVGEDEVFVMGDNRANSDDSRNFGPVPAGSIVGHAFLLIWPPADFDTL